MIKYILIFIVFFVILSCNEAFDTKNPYTVNKDFTSKVENHCYFDSDCKENGYFCDKTKHLCINPCDTINHCGDNGVCTSSSLTDFTCSCNSQYFEDENHQCINPCGTAQCPDNSNNGTGVCTSTSLTEYSCSCNEQYFEDENHQCVNPVKEEEVQFPYSRQ